VSALKTRLRRTRSVSYASLPSAWGSRLPRSTATTALVARRAGTSVRTSIASVRIAARRQFDIVMAWSVDRLGRSLQNLVGFLSEIHALKIGLDTTTPAGKAMFQMMGVFAEFEGAMIQRRVRAGLRRARETGTKSGKAIGRPTMGMTAKRYDPELERGAYRTVLPVASVIGLRPRHAACRWARFSGLQRRCALSASQTSSQWRRETEIGATMDEDDGGVFRLMRRVGVPLTRKNYLDLANLGEASPRMSSAPRRKRGCARFRRLPAAIARPPGGAGRPQQFADARRFMR
jgi:hypothetical protein